MISAKERLILKEKFRPVLPAFPFKCPPAQPTRRALELTDFLEPDTDPFGSYTGRPEQPREKPIQDADDL